MLRSKKKWKAQLIEYVNINNHIYILLFFDKYLNSIAPLAKCLIYYKAHCGFYTYMHIHNSVIILWQIISEILQRKKNGINLRTSTSSWAHLSHLRVDTVKKCRIVQYHSSRLKSNHKWITSSTLISFYMQARLICSGHRY